jgi:hypothetical protein
MADNNDETDPVKKMIKDLFNGAKKFISEDINRMTDQFGQLEQQQYEEPQQPAKPKKEPVRKATGKKGGFQL